MPVSAHKKRRRVKFPLDLSFGKKKTYKLNRAIDRPTVIRISESGKLLLVESGIRQFFFVESVILGYGISDWNPESSVWTPESKSVLSCLFV